MSLVENQCNRGATSADLHEAASAAPARGVTPGLAASLLPARPTPAVALPRHVPYLPVPARCACRRFAHNRHAFPQHSREPLELVSWARCNVLGALRDPFARGAVASTRSYHRGVLARAACPVQLPRGARA